MKGGHGRDALFGGKGHDALNGGRGHDALDGGHGRDLVRGGAGDDAIEGGAGKDMLIGGSGADMFVFVSVAHSKRNKADIIRDFDANDDGIDLAAIDADTGSAGDQAFDFIGAARFSGAAGELRHAGLKLQADVDGDGRADFVVKLLDAGTLGADDFLL